MIDLCFLHRLADAADHAILPHFRRLPEIGNKAGSGFDPVTVADRAAETAMRAIIGRDAPNAGILAEEFDNVPDRGGGTFILDPIDGTRAFICGLPVWGTLIGYDDGTGPSLGVMSQAFVNERFDASPDGAFHRRNGTATRLTTRPCPRLADAIVATTGLTHLPEPLRGLVAALDGSARMLRTGTDCYGYAMLAGGHIDAVVEVGLKAYDIAPFVPMIEAAGGRVTDLAGNRVGPTLATAFKGEVVAVGDPVLLPELLDALAA